MPSSEPETRISVPKLLPLLAVAEALSLSPHTVRKMVRDGRLQPVRICRRLLFRPADIERIVAGSATQKQEATHD